MPGDETGMDVEVVTESAAVQVAGSRMPRRGQIVFNLDADRSETMDLDPDPTRVGPGAGVGTHVAAGHSGMSGASLSAYSGRQQDSEQGPGSGTRGHTDSQPGALVEHQPLAKKKKSGSRGKNSAAKRLAPRGALRK